MMSMQTFAIMSFPFSVYFSAAAASLAWVLLGFGKISSVVNFHQIYSAEQPISNMLLKISQEKLKSRKEVKDDLCSLGLLFPHRVGWWSV